MNGLRRLQNYIGGSDCSIRPSAFETPLKTTHAHYEIITFDMLSLVKVHGNLDDAAANPALELILRNHTKCLRSRQLNITCSCKFLA